MCFPLCSFAILPLCTSYPHKRVCGWRQLYIPLYQGQSLAILSLSLGFCGCHSSPASPLIDRQRSSLPPFRHGQTELMLPLVPLGGAQVNGWSVSSETTLWFSNCSPLPLRSGFCLCKGSSDLSLPCLVVGEALFPLCHIVRAQQLWVPNNKVSLAQRGSHLVEVGSTLPWLHSQPLVAGTFCLFG